MSDLDRAQKELTHDLDRVIINAESLLLTKAEPESLSMAINMLKAARRLLNDAILKQ
jgi:hypothetical protein